MDFGRRVLPLARREDTRVLHCRRPHGPCAACRYTVWDVRKNVTHRRAFAHPAGIRTSFSKSWPEQKGRLARDRWDARAQAVQGRHCRGAEHRPANRTKGGIKMSKGTVIDRTGERYGRLVVLELAPSEGAPGARWLCQCDCERLICSAAAQEAAGACRQRSGERPRRSGQRRFRHRQGGASATTCTAHKGTTPAPGHGAAAGAGTASAGRKPAEPSGK